MKADPASSIELPWQLAAARGKWSRVGDRLDRLDPISMVHLDALAALAELASVATGPVLEVGPFTGGSTLALCMGLPPDDRNGRPLITIEMGGSVDHPRTPSRDILADLRRNLEAFGELDRVRIIEGLSNDPLVLAAARRELAGAPVGLLVVDANGLLDEQVVALSPLLSPDCLLSIDDYYCVDGSPSGLAKAETVQAWLGEAEASGIVQRFGVFGDGTWMGRLTGPAALATLRARRRPFTPDSGHCHLLDVALPTPPDTATHPGRSRLRLLEDGRTLGPGHCLHAEIRAVGAGRHSHWSDARPWNVPRPSVAGLFPATLFMSSSDNSDPRRNGRLYEVEIEGLRVALTG